jgi:hypothetical protein
VQGGTPSNSNFTVKGKYVKLLVDNAGGGSQNVLKIFSYGNYSSFDLDVSNVLTVPDFPEIPKTPYGSMDVAAIRPLLQYDTSYTNQEGWFGLDPADGTYPWVTRQQDIRVLQVDVTGAGPGPRTGILGAGYLQYTMSGALTIRPDVVSPGPDPICYTLRGFLYSRTERCRVGQGIKSRFSAAFSQATRFVGTPETVYQGVGMGTLIDHGYAEVTNPEPLPVGLYEFYGFGFGETSQGNIPDDTFFDIIIYERGVKRTIRKQNWNLDRADGTQELPVLSWRLLNSFQVDRTTLGCGKTLFYVMNPNDGNYVAVHVDVTCNTASASDNTVSSLGMVMFYEDNVDNNSRGSPFFPAVSVGGFMMGSIGQPLKFTYEKTVLYNTVATVIPSNVFSTVVNFRIPTVWFYTPSDIHAPPVDPTSGQLSRLSIQITSLMVVPDGNDMDYIIFLLRNVPRSGVANWQPDLGTRDVLPLEYDTGTTFTGAFPSSGSVMTTRGTTRSKELSDFDLTAEDLVFSNGDVITLAIYNYSDSASPDIFYSLGLRML